MEDTNLKEMPLEETPRQPIESTKPIEVPADSANESQANESPAQKSPASRIQTPSTENRSAVKAPDDTFPGSGPAHPSEY